MKSLTIALCLHGYFPEQFFGTAVYIRQLAQALQRAGHRPVVIAPRFDPGSSVATLAPMEWVNGIEVLRILRPGARGMRDSFDDPRLVPALEAAFRSIKPDVVHVAHFLGLTTALFTAAQALHLPVFATLTDFHGFCHRGTLVNGWGRACGGPNRWRTNCIGCGLRDRATENPNSLKLAYLASWFARPTTSVALPLMRSMLPDPEAQDVGAIQDRPGHLRTTMATVRAAIAPTRFLRDAYCRNGFTMPIEVRAFGIDADRSIKPGRRNGALQVGFIGQISRHKGCHILIEAARHLRPGTAEIQVWGDMSRHPGYADALRRAAVGHDIAFRGGLAIEELDGALRGFDVLVMPSTWSENAPLTLLQALACHTPCIVSDQPGMMEAVSEGLNGHIVPAGDAKALARAIEMVAATPGHLDRLTAATHYDHDSTAMAGHVLSLYQRYGVDMG